MTELSIEIQNKDSQTLLCEKGENRIVMTYFDEYNMGDKIVLRSSEKNIYLILRLDDAMNEEFVYFASGEMVFEIPFDEKRTPYSPRAFTGDRHVLWVRTATDDEISTTKNLARNCYDQHCDTGLFPHAFANVETRGESVFAAKNAINGNTANKGHGLWPFESWGINMQEDAEITIEFGRTVRVDGMALITRADFPHDNYWKQVTFIFSDGSTMEYKMEKSDKPHIVELSEKKYVNSIKLCNLIKDEGNPSPFPALTQWEIYGADEL